METPGAAEYAPGVSATRERDSEPTRTVSPFLLILELYRAAEETPVAEFPHLARAMIGALPQSEAAVVASHIGNAIRINRTLCPRPADDATDEQGSGFGHTG